MNELELSDKFQCEDIIYKVVTKQHGQEDQQEVVLEMFGKQFLLNKYQCQNLLFRLMTRQLDQEDHREVLLEVFGKPEVIDREVLATGVREIWKFDEVDRFENEAAKKKYRLIITIENEVVTKFVTKGDALNTLDIRMLTELGITDFWNKEAAAEQQFDPLFWEALKVVGEKEEASVAVLQKYLRISYGRAAAILDSMEEIGFIESSDGAQPREVSQLTYESLANEKTIAMDEILAWLS